MDRFGDHDVVAWRHEPSAGRCPVHAHLRSRRATTPPDAPRDAEYQFGDADVRRQNRQIVGEPARVHPSHRPPTEVSPLANPWRRVGMQPLAHRIEKLVDGEQAMSEQQISDTGLRDEPPERGEVPASSTDGNRTARTTWSSSARPQRHCNCLRRHRRRTMVNDPTVVDDDEPVPDA